MKLLGFLAFHFLRHADAFVKVVGPPAHVKCAKRDVDLTSAPGFVCEFSALEPCRTFLLHFTTGQPNMRTAKRKYLAKGSMR